MDLKLTFNRHIQQYQDAMFIYNGYPPLKRNCHYTSAVYYIVNYKIEHSKNTLKVKKCTTSDIIHTFGHMYSNFADMDSIK